MMVAFVVHIYKKLVRMLHKKGLDFSSPTLGYIK